MSKFQPALLTVAFLTGVSATTLLHSPAAFAKTAAATEIAATVGEASDDAADSVSDAANKANDKAKAIKDSIAAKASTAVDVVKTKTIAAKDATATAASAALAKTSTAIAPTAPTPPAPPAAPTAPIAATPQTKTDKLSVGEINVSHISASAKSSDIDVYFTVENTSKIDDGLSDAETTLDGADVVLVKKDADGKAVEAPISTPLAAGKSVDFTSGTTFLRIKGVKKSVKEGDVIPLMLHFRRAPNASLKVGVTNKSSVLGGLFGGN